MLIKKNVYSCVRNDKYFYTIEEMKKQIESGDYKRLGALTDVNIVCPSSNYGNFFYASIISFIFSLFIFL